MRFQFNVSFVLGAIGCIVTLTASGQLQAQSYSIVDTGQTTFYANSGTIGSPSGPSSPFYGQDAQFTGNTPSYSVLSNGAVIKDNVTGLTWRQTIDVDGTVGININDKMTRTELTNYVSQLNATSFGGRSDWRVPSVKELYSLIQFNGVQPMPHGTTSAGGKLFIDDTAFGFGWGDVSGGDRIIDMQVWSSTTYTSTTMNNDRTFMSVNFADGRIKGYPEHLTGTTSPREYYAMVVAGNEDYGQNAFVVNGDGTVSDSATQLQWTQHDSAQRMTWQAALTFAQDMNAINYLGYKDWRLPNAKELQSIVDYSRSPDATGSPAINPVFSLTMNELTAQDFTGVTGDYGFHWSSTTFLEVQGSSVSSSSAVYLSFGETLGLLPPGNTVITDVHGAGAQRTDPKALGGILNPGNFFGPQNDYIGINNYVFLVRDVTPVPDRLHDQIGGADAKAASEPDKISSSDSAQH